MYISEQDWLMIKYYIFVKHVYIIENFFTFITSSSEEKCKKQLQVINVMIALCSLQKSWSFHHQKRFTLNIKLEKENTSLTLFKFISFEFKFTQCIFYFNDEKLLTVKHCYETACAFSQEVNREQRSKSEAMIKESKTFLECIYKYLFNL